MECNNCNRVANVHRQQQVWIGEAKPRLKYSIRLAICGLNTYYAIKHQITKF